MATAGASAWAYPQQHKLVTLSLLFFYRHLSRLQHAGKIHPANLLVHDLDAAVER